MNCLADEINKFLIYSNYAENTKNKYKNKLLGFAKFLANNTDTTLDELHLLKVYEVYDTNDNFISYRPLNVLLVDSFFNSLIDNGYYGLRDNRDALAAFFLYLNRNYNFPNLMNEIDFDLNQYRPKNKRTNILSKHDTLKLIHYIVAEGENLERDVLLFSLFLMTGARLSEIADLKVKDILWEDNTIYIAKTKPNKSKIIPLKSGLSEDIKRYCIINKLDSNDSLFNLSKDQIRNLFYSYLNKAHLPKVNLHSLRHSFATTMVESGASITEVQQLLGHADVITTKGYVQTNISRNKNIVIKENNDIFRYVSKKFLKE